jgi:hypothetical protein
VIRSTPGLESNVNPRDVDQPPTGKLLSNSHAAPFFAFDQVRIDGTAANTTSR